MKPFQEYQYLEGTQMTDRDKLEVGSKFWNKGKWDNFVLPLIKEVDKDMTFVDMGCNAGLFLKFAEDMGFGHVVGVDSNEEAVKRGAEWRDKNGGKYRFLCAPMEKCIDELPCADYTVFANSHYYYTINDFLDHLDILQYKTRYVIIVTAEKRHLNRCWASADIQDIRRWFKLWEEVGFIDEIPTEGDPVPRRLWALCFKSPYLERIPASSLDASNHVQDQFWGEIDEGKDYHDTRYYHILVPYRKDWGKERLDKWMEDRIKVYLDIKANGMKKPLLIDQGVRILDGNHRYSGMINLGNKSILVRRA